MLIATTDWIRPQELVSKIDIDIDGQSQVYNPLITGWSLTP